MSRGVKDLRELICVSRLTVRGSDEELGPLSDEEGRLSRAFSRVSFESSASSSRQSSAHSLNDVPGQKSPDSGIGTNGVSPEGETITGAQKLPHPPDVSKPTTARKKKRRKKPKSHTVSIGHELPKSTPLAPISHLNGDRLRRSSGSSEDSISVPLSRPAEKDGMFKDGGNFDDMLMYIDASVISEWLISANDTVAKLTSWCHSGDNFVQFAHFWLTDIPDMQRQELYSLEHSILSDHLAVAFSVGRDAGKIRHKDIYQFLNAIFREYPGRLLSSTGVFLFLDHLAVLTSERTSAYKRLLSDVLCSTRIKQHAQWVLAMRAFCLVSVWDAVIVFYRKLVTRSSQKGIPLPSSTIGKTDPNPERINLAIRLGYIDVIHYMLVSRKVKATHRDSHQRSLVFTAVMHNQPDVLHYLITQAKPHPDVNAPADTGNTPLHAAANNGDVIRVTSLLRAENINVNPVNKKCNDATPLHLAVMHGHRHVVDVLLVAGGDTKAKMDNLTPLELAREFGHSEIVEILEQDNALY